jgi:hypothetical protein
VFEIGVHNLTCSSSSISQRRHSSSNEINEFWPTLEVMYPLYVQSFACSNICWFSGRRLGGRSRKIAHGFERRTKEQQRRARKKTQRRMSNNVQLSKSFLQYVVSSEESEKGNPISLMSHCTLFLEQVENAGVVAFSEGSPNVEKVRLSLESLRT